MGQGRQAGRTSVVVAGIGFFCFCFFFAAVIGII